MKNPPGRLSFTLTEKFSINLQIAVMANRYYLHINWFCNDRNGVTSDSNGQVWEAKYNIFGWYVSFNHLCLGTVRSASLYTVTPLSTGLGRDYFIPLAAILILSVSLHSHSSISSWWWPWLETLILYAFYDVFSWLFFKIASETKALSVI